MRSNPLLEKREFLPYNAVKDEDFLPALDHWLRETEKRIKKIAENPAVPDFENTLIPLETCEEELSAVTTCYYHLFSAHTSPRLQELAPVISAKLAAFSNDFHLNRDLFARLEQLQRQPDTDPVRRRLTEETYRSFLRNGARLSDEDRQNLRDLDAEISGCSPAFSDHVLQATNHWFHHSKTPIPGLPERHLKSAAAEAARKNLEGYVVTLQAPSFLPFMTYCTDRRLREEVFRAYSARCVSGEFSNDELLKKLLSLKRRRARLLGYEDHPDYVLEKRMLRSAGEVNEFLSRMHGAVKVPAAQDLALLQEELSREIPGAVLQPWDVRYCSEKLKHRLFEFDEEMLRPYFSLKRSLEGIFIILHKLYGLSFTPESLPVYHEDVKTYRVEREGGLIGHLYLDLFPRDNKKGGAWMNSFQNFRAIAGHERKPQVIVVGNFTPPDQNGSDLLAFDEVKTLFHEFGHAIHGLLTRVPYPSLGGTNVYWDFVELPSQLMENWLFEPEALDLFARHQETGEKIPGDLLRKIKEERKFLAGHDNLRQLEFACLDMAWYLHPDPESCRTEEFERLVLGDIRQLPFVDGCPVSPAFSHIFAGGYGAGYYSYKWAEMLEADAFSVFTRNGIFDRKTADSFRKNILEAGNSEDPMTLYARFRGARPDENALLEREGLIRKNALATAPVEN